MATLEPIVSAGKTAEQPSVIEAPASTGWPLVLAFGFTLIFAGLLTSISVSVLGALLTVSGCAGWFREVLPGEHEVAVAVVAAEVAPATQRRIVDRLPVPDGQVRAWLPLHTHPISAGLKGGMAGGVAMAALACAYGLFKASGIWYPVNLLAASVYAQSLKLGTSELNAFHSDSFAIALGIHVLISLSVGLLYGAMLPMFTHRPILLGGLIGPVLWSGLLYSILSLVNPLLESHIDWLWFVVSQVAFGIVAGLVVVRQPRIPTRENAIFAIRAGVEAPGITPPHPEEERP